MYIYKRDCASTKALRAGRSADERRSVALLFVSAARLCSSMQFAV
jgi:hypothetical protein